MRQADIRMATASLSVNMARGPDIVDITHELLRLVTQDGFTEGALSATMVGSTGSLTTIEFEPGVVEDLKAAVNRLAPPGLDYAHEQAWHDGNGHSHVQAALLGPSVTVPESVLTEMLPFDWYEVTRDPS